MIIHFSGAKSSQQITDEISVIFKKKKINSEDTLFAQSVCPDESKFLFYSIILYYTPLKSITRQET